MNLTFINTLTKDDFSFILTIFSSVVLTTIFIIFFIIAMYYCYKHNKIHDDL